MGGLQMKMNVTPFRKTCFYGVFVLLRVQAMFGWILVKVGNVLATKKIAPNFWFPYMVRLENLTVVEISEFLFLKHGN
jgi:glutamate formiminotransferase